jgi:hypothetical protein
MKSEMGTALEQASETNKESLEQTAAKVNEEGRANADRVVAGVQQSWSGFAKTVIGAAIVSSAVAIAVTVGLVTLT